MIVVRKFLQLVADEGIELIGGEDGLDKTIDYLSVQEFSLKSARIKNNGFIMTTFLGFKDIDEIIKHCIWYSKMKISGIGIHTVHYHTISQEILKFSNDEKIPLFRIPVHVPYSVLFEKYNELVYEENMKMKAKTEELNKKMMDALLLEKSTHFLIQSFSQYLNSPVVYLNKKLEVISIYNPFHTLKTELTVILEKIKNEYQTVLKEARYKNKHIEIKATAHNLNYLRVIPLMTNIKFFGFLMIAFKEKTDTFQSIVIQNAIPALIIDAIKRDQTREYQKNEDCRLFEKIFSGDTHGILMESFNIDINRVSYILIAEPENSETIRECFNRIHDKLEEIDSNVLVWISKKQIVAALQKQLNMDIFNQLKVRFGKSGDIEKCKIETIKQAFIEAKVSLSFTIMKNSNFIEWKDLGIEKVLYFMNQSPFLKNFYAERIGCLIEGDRIHNTDMVETLYVYLKNFFGLKESGKELHLHPNTVKYRIDKIQDLLKVNLNDPDHFMNVMMALQIFFYNEKNKL